MVESRISTLRYHFCISVTGESMHQWTTGNIDIHGTRLHYYRSIASKPPMVLVHGITDDGLCWSPAAEVLSDEYDVVMVDLRGHGKSDAPEEGYDRMTMAAELSEFIIRLGFEKPILIGHSLGGMVVLTLASLAPDLPLAVVVEDSPPYWREHSLSPDEVETRAGMRMWMCDLKRKTRDELLEIARSENPSWSEAELGPWADSKHRFSLKITHIIDALDSDPKDASTLLTRITCPVLLITADPERGAILTDEDVTELEKSIPHIKQVHIPGAGHNIRREQFSSYMEAVQAFLRQVRT
jgi:N-formylmaleamate deformylase